MEQKMFKAVIFDMDGLMIDSEVVTYRCYQEVMAKMNETISLEFYKTLLGKGSLLPENNTFTF